MYITADGSKYDGDWKDDCMDGEGKPMRLTKHRNSPL